MQTTLKSTSDGLQPTIGDTGLAVAELVRACHEATIDVGLERLSVPGLDRDTIGPLLTYCAERRCEADAATCPGCKRRTEAQGVTSLDEFIARHREIVIGDGRVRLCGEGRETLHVPCLDTLSRQWSGENYWFWSRRVIRKLRHGIRRAHIQGSAFAGIGETPSILLMEPQLADNIGMVARAMANFGLDELRLISPRDGWPNEKARIAASGANYVIDDARAFSTLPDAMADCHWVAATTARQRDLRKPVLTPEQAVAEMRRRMASGERCGVLFGRERNGLETSEVADADALIMIPVNAEFASLNLAQAVLIIGYEWMRTNQAASLGRVTTYERPIETGLQMGNSQAATKQELAGFFAHIETELDRLGYYNPPEKRPTQTRNLRALFTRAECTEQEVRTLRGVVAALVKGKGTGRKAP